MLKRTTLAAALALGLGLSAPAVAEEIPQGVFFEQQQPTQFLARDLVLGAKIYGPDDKIVGDVEDLILNEDNQIVGVIMGVGGFLGVGEKRIAVRYRALEFKTEDSGAVKVSLPEATQAVLKAVPAYERAAPKKSLLDRAIEKARELRDKTTETSKTAYERAKEAAGPAYERAKEAAGRVVDQAREAATPENPSAPTNTQ